MSEAHALRTRVPGQSAMSDVVRQHKLAPPRSRIDRLFGVNPLARVDRQSYRGALGELLVGDALDQLGPEWDVLHAVPVGPGEPEIDHVVIGPAGVFAITTKNHSGEEVSVDGEVLLASARRQHHVRDALFVCQRAAVLLTSAAQRKVEVTAIIAIVNPKRLRVRQQPTAVTVLSSQQLVRWITKREISLSGAEVAFISDVADRATTWHVGDEPAHDTQQLHRDFSRLRAEVIVAARHRVIWVGATLVTVFSAAWAATAHLVTTMVG